MQCSSFYNIQMYITYVWAFNFLVLFIFFVTRLFPSFGITSSSCICWSHFLVAIHIYLFVFFILHAYFIFKPKLWPLSVRGSFCILRALWGYCLSLAIFNFLIANKPDNKYLLTLRLLFYLFLCIFIYYICKQFLICIFCSISLTNALYAKKFVLKFFFYF